MACSGLYPDGITQVDRFDPAERTMLVKIDHYVIRLDFL